MARPSVHREMLKCWNQRDYRGMRKLMHPDYRYTGSDGKEVEGGQQAGIDIAKMFATAFPDGVATITNNFKSGHFEVCEFVARGTHGGELMGIAPTHKPVEIRVCNIIELRDGKIYREREYMDMLSTLAQLGVKPEPPTVYHSEGVKHAPH